MHIAVATPARILRLGHGIGMSETHGRWCSCHGLAGSLARRLKFITAWVCLPREKIIEVGPEQAA